MAKNLASAYNPPEEKNKTPEISREEHLACKANGCPLPGSIMVEGGPWLCPYHSRRPRFFWDDITFMLRQNMRLLKLINVVQTLRCDEFDQIQASGKWQIEEMVQPFDSESHPHWQNRVKQSIHRALKHKANKIVGRRDLADKGMSPVNESSAVTQLTNGTLLRNKFKTKSREQQLSELNAKQGEQAA